MRTRSLRTRLVATMLVLLAVASAGVALVTALALRQFLMSRLDAELGRANRVVVSITAPADADLPPLPEPRSGRGPGPLGSLNALIEHGRVVEATVLTAEGGTEAVPATEYPDLTSLPADGRRVSADIGVWGAYRLVATALPNDRVLVTGLTQRPVEETITQLVVIELVVTGAALLGAGLIGASVVRRQLRPLERVAATAARVSTLPLDRGEVSLAERVPDTEERTEVGQVGAALNRMLDHVGSALAARQDSETQLRQFVADASHELRTPLAAIRGYAELSRRGDLAAETAYSLARISSQAERMTGLVEDLLLLARLDAGRPLDHGEVDLTRLVVDAVSDAHASGPAHRWQLDLPAEPVTVVGDGQRLAQVLANLLANARTHTPPDTVVTVALVAAGSDIRLGVVDTGPGIAPELVPHVFERFARGSCSRSREHGSTGLGLAIVDAVVAAHGGTVEVQSRPGRTEFAVRLPAAPSPRCASRPIPARESPVPRA